MALTTLTARVDQKDKADFDAFCSNVGLNTSTAINLFVKAVLREKRIPFEIAQTPDPFFSEANMTLIFASINKIARNKNDIRILIRGDLGKAGINDCACFGNTFLIRSASSFICRPAGLKRSIIIMSICNKIKRKFFHIITFFPI